MKQKIKQLQSSGETRKTNRPWHFLSTLNSLLLSKLLLLLIIPAIGSTAAWAASGDVLFSQSFTGAGSVAYAANTARAYTKTSELDGIVGDGSNLFTSITCNAKNNCGIGINHATGGNNRNYTGKFGAYFNNTEGLWSICRTADFAATAPTAIKVEFKLLFSYVAGGTPIEFAVGSGFSDAVDAPAFNKAYTGFGINTGSAQNIKICKFKGTSALNNTSITNNSELKYTWVINNSGKSLEYTDPNGETQALADGTWDLWIGNTQYINDQNRATAGNTSFTGTTLQNIYIGDPQGKKR